jgi:hypothetical protein
MHNWTVRAFHASVVVVDFVGQFPEPAIMVEGALLMAK